MSLLCLPTEVRLLVYDEFFSRHTVIERGNQPRNTHLALTRVCRTIRAEAAPLLHTYISLRTENQIAKFIYHPDAARCNVVTWADVANDGRIMLNREGYHTSTSPVSRLFLALRRMPNLQTLRVFDAKQGLRAPDGPKFHKKVVVKSEEAMFPDDGAMSRKRPISTYKLSVAPTTRSTLFTNIPSMPIHTLSLSGDCTLPDSSKFPNLQNLTLDAVSGNHFEIRTLETTFSSSQLRSFRYRSGGMASFDLRDSHLESLAVIGGNLVNLSLLGCSRLTGNALAILFDELRYLAYLALDIITVRELDVGFIHMLSPKLDTLKFAITNVHYARPLVSEEIILCDEIESLMDRPSPPQLICLKLRDEVLQRSERWSRWTALAKQHGIDLRRGDWRRKEPL